MFRIDFHTKFWLAVQLAIIAAYFVFTSCKLSPVKPISTVTVVQDKGKLSWEEGHPERKSWGYYLVGRITEELSVLNTANDIEYFCPKYKILENKDKVFVWTELIIEISKYESNWNPRARFFEDTMGYYSEGLMQISVQDNKWTPGCKLTAKSILEPIPNLDCAMTIFTSQIKRKGLINLKKGSYWAVITIGHKNSKIKPIKHAMNLLARCV